MAQDIYGGNGAPFISEPLGGAINYVTGYRSMAADVARAASPDSEWIKWKEN
jgi:hypothetical protein